MRSERPATAVDEALARLREQFGPISVVERTWTVDEVTYDQTAARAAAGTVGGAGAWIRRDRDGETEALMVREDEYGGWSEPAGKQEPGESLGAAACRETFEETGVECRLTGVLRAERAIHVLDSDVQSPPIPRLIVVFDAEYLRGTPRANDEQIDAVAWHTQHPENLRYPDVSGLPLE